MTPEQKKTDSDDSAEPSETKPGLVEQFNEAQKADGKSVDWKYSGEKGPDNWGRLADQFAMCELGKNQSPINIENALELASPPEISVTYGEAPIKVVHTGHVLQVDVPSGNSMKVGGRTFELLQFHFHAPAEHRIEGEEFPLEIHFVHKNEAGELGVLGVMFEEGDANEQLQALVENLPEGEGESTSLEKGAVDMTGLVPESRSAYRYSGSLTTPPCAEGVHWHLLTEPLTASTEQIDALKSAVGHDTNRPIQPVGARLIVR